MKSLTRMALIMLMLMGCDSNTAVDTAVEQDCKAIVSDLERLACFDVVAGTPPVAVKTVSVQPAQVEVTPRTGLASSEIVALVRRNESGRGQYQTGLRLLQEAGEAPGQKALVLSSPTVDGNPRTPHLAISCLSNISRLQLVAEQPLEVDRMDIRLLLDGRPLGTARPWQVLDEGLVVDAGRGLVAIEQLRLMTAAASLLRVESNYAPFDGLSFNVSGLHRQIAHQREACRW